jgi:hypothetical protein
LESPPALEPALLIPPAFELPPTVLTVPAELPPVEDDEPAAPAVPPTPPAVNAPESPLLPQPGVKQAPSNTVAAKYPFFILGII